MSSTFSPEIKFKQSLFLVPNKEQKLIFVKSGETIFTPEKSPEILYFSLQGVVELSIIYQTGQKNLIALLPEQSFLGLSSLRSDKLTQEYHAVAFTPVILVSMPIWQFQQELQKSPELSTLVTQRFLSRLLTAEMTIESRLQKTLEARLISFLLIISHDFGVKTDSGVKIDLQLNYRILADLINSSRVSVSRVLTQLQQQHLISIQQQKITLHDPSALSQYIDFTIP